MNSSLDTISWHLFLNTRTQKGAQRIMTRVRALLDIELEAETVEPYWKDPQLSDVRVLSSWSPDDPAAACFQLMMLVGGLTYSFTTSAPHLDDDGELTEFRLIAHERFRVSGVEWLEASIGSEFSRKPANDRIKQETYDHH